MAKTIAEYTFKTKTSIDNIHINKVSNSIPKVKYNKWDSLIMYYFLDFLKLKDEYSSNYTITNNSTI